MVFINYARTLVFSLRFIGWCWCSIKWCYRIFLIVDFIDWFHNPPYLKTDVVTLSVLRSTWREEPGTISTFLNAATFWSKRVRLWIGFIICSSIKRILGSWLSPLIPIRSSFFRGPGFVDTTVFGLNRLCRYFFWRAYGAFVYPWRLILLRDTLLGIRDTNLSNPSNQINREGSTEEIRSSADLFVWVCVSAFLYFPSSSFIFCNTFDNEFQNSEDRCFWYIIQSIE